MGDQPIHVYFFQPDYTPQFLPGEATVRSGSIIIDKALIHEYALREAGLDFDLTEGEAYVLDGRLHYVSQRMSLRKHMIRINLG